MFSVNAVMMVKKFHLHMQWDRMMVTLMELEALVLMLTLVMEVVAVVDLKEV